MKDIKIGWIGTGVMGLSMCQRLLDDGYICYVNNRTACKARSLVDNGAIYLDTPKQIARECDIIFTIVGYPEDVEEVYFSEHGLFQGSKKGQIFCDMTTTKPSLSKKIYSEGKKRNICCLDAPVSGGDIGAKNGTLSIMVGGDQQCFETLIPFFKILGKNYIYQGPAGCGQHTKMANQITIAGIMGGVCESLIYSSKVGLNLTTMVNTIKNGAAGCWTLENLAPRIIDNNFDPGFYIDHFIKDMEIALDEAKRQELNLPTLNLVHKLYKQMQKNGNGKLGTQALFLALKQMNK